MHLKIETSNFFDNMYVDYRFKIGADDQAHNNISNHIIIIFLGFTTRYQGNFFCRKERMVIAKLPPTNPFYDCIKKPFFHFQKKYFFRIFDL